MGPKSENVENQLVFVCFFEGSRTARGIQENKRLSERGTFRRRNDRFLVQNASCRFWELCFLLGQGAHFCKHREQIWPESEKCTPKTLDGDFDA